MKFRERYKFDSKTDFIGKGGFAKVYRAFDTIRKRDVALKFYHGTASAKYDIISEINRMYDIIHPNLIRYYDADIIQSVNAIGEREQIQVGILEYANKGDVAAFFTKPQSDATKRTVILGILEGLTFLHTNGIIHRDLKPKNILLSEINGNIHAKIADFGISKKVSNFENDMSSQILGSVEYMAPEQFASGIYGIEGKLHTNVDLWSLGVILYEIFSTELPFGSRTGGINYEEILNNILFKEFEIDYSRIPEPYRSVIARCLIKNASERARGADELLDIMHGRAANKLTIPPPIKTQETVNRRSKTDVYDDLIIRDSEEPASNNLNTEILENRHTPSNKPSVRRPVEPPKKRVEKFIPSTPVFIPHSNASVSEINVGKNLFKLKNYVDSFKVLSKYQLAADFDVEARFYLGYMYYNGKCGGAHDEKLGRQLMNEAKAENRPLVSELLIKYVLN